MLKLRRDLSRAVTILEMIKRREKSKRELLHLTLEIVEKRWVLLRDTEVVFKGMLLGCQTSWSGKLSILETDQIVLYKTMHL